MVQVTQKRTAVLVAIRVKSLIEKKGITRAKLAQACGVTLSAIRTLLDPSMHKTAQIGLVDDVADYFGVSTESLVCLATTQNHLEQFEKKQEAKPKAQPQPLESPQAEAKKMIGRIFASVEKTVEKLQNQPKPIVAPEEKTESEGVAATFPVKGGKEWILTGKAVLELQTAYPGVVILKEVREAVAWCKANPTLQKTAKGMPRFLNSWMSRASKQAEVNTVDVDTPKPAEPTKYGYFDVDGDKTPYVKKSDAQTAGDFPDDVTEEPEPEIVADEPFSDDGETFEVESFQPDGADF